MLAAITILLLYQLAGELISQAFGLPIPGPVIGMALLFITLVLRGGPGEDLRETSRKLLQYLSMLFIPAGAGVMLHFGTLRTEWLPILLATTLGTLIVIVLTAGLMQFLIRRRPPDDDGQPSRAADSAPTRNPQAVPASPVGTPGGQSS